MPFAVSASIVPPSSVSNAGVAHRTRLWQRLTIPLSALLVSGLLLSGPAGGAKPGEPAITGAGDLDQCGNGPLAAPDDPCDWVNGNLHDTNSHFYESESVPYRLKLTGLSAGPHTVDIGFDVMNSGKHAFDYLTSYDRIAEDVDPCAGIATCSGSPQLVALPAPNGASSGTPSSIPAASFGDLLASEREMAAWGITITSIAYLSQGDLAAANSEASIRVSFLATGSSGLLAWGGHIASQEDWGVGQSAAGGISGSPYHMRLLSVDGSGGNQDRSLRGAAVLPALPLGGSLTIVKQVVNDQGGAQAAADFSLHVLYAGNSSNVPGSPQPGSGIGTSYVDLPAGAYLVTEDAAVGYAASFSGDCASDGSLTLADGDIKQCIVTNNDTGARLTVTKQVTNDDGGTAGVSGFMLFVDETQVASGQSTPFLPGTYQVSEVGAPGYLGSFSGDCAADGSVSLANGDSKTCTLSNDDIQPRLNVTKVVINDNGGDAQVSDFALSVGETAVSSGVEGGFDAGTYQVSESGPDGYQASFSGDCDAGGNVSLSVGDEKECTITNDDIGPLLTVVKVFVNDDGGSAVVADADLFVDGAPVTSGEQNGFDAGGHQVTEDGPDGYAAGFSEDCDADGNITLALADVKSCLLTNDDIQPILTVTKIVINDNGGEASIEDFPLYVDDVLLTSGQAQGLDGGAYTVSEQGSAAYAATIGGDCGADGSIELAIGQTYACSITNDDIQPRLNVTKVIINDDGGEAQVGDFALFVGQQSVLSGQEHGFDAGSYSVHESGPSGYAASFSGDCDANGTIVLAVGDQAECTITNNDIRPLLTVRKTVVNDHGGEAEASDWSFFVDDAEVGLGNATGFDAGTYTVSESGPDGYALSFGGEDCLEGIVQLFVGDEKECILTNDDIQPILTVSKLVVNDDGGLASEGDWSFLVDESEVELDAATGFDAGSHQVSESGGPSGYSLSYSGDCDEDGTVLLAIGEEYECLLTNDDIEPILTVTKVVVNDDGGAAEVSDFDLLVGIASVISGEPSGFSASLEPYQVSESGPAGYAASFSGDCDENGTVSLSVGEVKSCTLTNDDIRPLLTVRKGVINDHGGDAEASDWSFLVDDLAVALDNATGFMAGSHQVSESGGPSGYALSYSGDCDEDGTVLMAIGEEYECLLTNDDIQPLLTVRKTVINDDGGDAGAGDWSFAVDDQAVVLDAATGFDAGNHSVSESDGPSGYALSYSGDCDENGTVLMAIGEEYECLLTNDDVQPLLTVTKIVVNDDGGLAIVNDTSLFVDEEPVLSGVAEGFDAANYSVSETGPFGYAPTFSGDCDADGNVSLAIGEEYECFLTNDDIQPILMVTKVVINDDGGAAEASDFVLAVSGSNVTSGEPAGFDAGTYTVTESGPSGYAASFSGDCDENGTVSLSVGQVKSCTLTNDDIQPRLTVRKAVVNDNGGAAEAGDWNFLVDGSAIALNASTGIDAGSHAVSESGPSGYTLSFSGDCDENGMVVMALAQEYECLLTNDDQQARLLVIKHVINDSGSGTKTAANFTLVVSATNASSTLVTGSESGVPVTLDAGVYMVIEPAVARYNTTYSAGCAGTLGPGENATCIVTNDDISQKRMTGGGSIGTSTVRHGFELHCDKTQDPNRLEVNWKGSDRKEHKFHLLALTSASCTDDPAIKPQPPLTPFDTYAGSGTGRLDGMPGATATWKFTDAGEPGKKDTAQITIKDAAGATVLTISGSLSSGNHQAHK